jgi:hypothetical protein
MSFEPEQLEFLKRRAEEDFKLDMAAIERLQRRLMAVAAGAISPISSPVSTVSKPEPSVPQSASVIFEALPVASQPDELGNSLRAMFSAAR